MLVSWYKGGFDKTGTDFLNFTDEDLKAAKSDMRRAAERRRARLQGDHAADASAVAALLGDMLARFPSGPVSAYLPIGSEIDTTALMDQVHRDGRELCLPVAGRVGELLQFRRWQPGQPTHTGVYNVQIPLDGAPVVTPAVLFVPLLAFDDAGYRLGYGGGFYDRTLERLRAAGDVTAIGLTYSGQEVPSVPHNAYDQPMDHILCETGWRHMRPGAGDFK